MLSCVQLFETPWTVAYQAPPSMGFSRQEYWRGLPFPFPGNLLDPGIEPGSPAFQADALTSEPPGKPRQNKAPRKDAHVQIPGACERHVTWLCCACLVAQSCPTLCDPMDCSPPCSSVRGIFQAKVTGVGCISFWWTQTSIVQTLDVMKTSLAAMLKRNKKQLELISIQFPLTQNF